MHWRGMEGANQPPAGYHWSILVSDCRGSLGVGRGKGQLVTAQGECVPSAPARRAGGLCNTRRDLYHLGQVSRCAGCRGWVLLLLLSCRVLAELEDVGAACYQFWGRCSWGNPREQGWMREMTRKPSVPVLGLSPPWAEEVGSPASALASGIPCAV